MSSSYDIWLTDDAGRRMALLNNRNAFFSYSRTTSGYGVVQLGMPYREYKKLVPTIFQVDWRLDIWRSPESSFPKRREGSFFLLKHNIYRREDGMEIIEFLGRSPIEILRRIDIADPAMCTIANDYADDAMKSIVNYYKGNTSFSPAPVTGGALLQTTNELTVDGDTSQGPLISKDSFLFRNALDVIQEIKSTTFQMNKASSSNAKIYFDMVESSGLENGFGYRFRTYANLRGADRTAGIVFSVENGNLKDPTYYEDYFDIITNALTYGTDDEFHVNVISTDSYLSRWSNIHKTERVNSIDNEEHRAEAYRVLEENKAIKIINCTFLNTPGGVNQPRSLYGMDWDLGDLLPVQFADKSMEAEVKIVYVAVNEDGEETITGRNEVGVA